MNRVFFFVIAPLLLLACSGRILRGDDSREGPSVDDAGTTLDAKQVSPASCASPFEGAEPTKAGGARLLLHNASTSMRYVVTAGINCAVLTVDGNQTELPLQIVCEGEPSMANPRPRAGISIPPGETRSFEWQGTVVTSTSGLWDCACSGWPELGSYERLFFALTKIGPGPHVAKMAASEAIPPNCWLVGDTLQCPWMSGEAPDFTKDETRSYCGGSQHLADAGTYTGKLVTSEPFELPESGTIDVKIEIE